MLLNLPEYQPPRQQGKTWLNTELIKYSVLTLKNPFMYFCFNVVASQGILWKTLPHLNIEVTSATWLKISPCHCMQRKG